MTEGHTERLEAALDGKYRIERKLGEGGMATVYLAEDIKHERKVALKILRPELAAVLGAERFLTEIKTTANLQHPHILALFDSGEADGYLYYVMPYIEGETLRERLEREQQLGVDEAVRIARDVADALDYAHRAGVIHRDIKPANILLHDGRPVVADFGIALAISAAGGGRMTETGLSLGTPHYMSPEQASADRDLSARSDVYSLGCVLYEMLAGQPPHTGPSAQSILVRILTEDPRPLTELRRTAPPNVAATVMKAIEKLPADRFESAKTFMGALDDPAFTYRPTERAGGSVAGSGAATTVPDEAPRSIRQALPWAVAAAMTVLAGWGWLGGAPPEEPGVPFRVQLTDFDATYGSIRGEQITVSPDGSAFVVAGFTPGEGTTLYLRRANNPGWRALEGTEGARSPTFSPDGAWLAFSTNGEISRLALAGGPTLPVAEGGSPHWGTQETIVFSREDGIYRVASSGGEPTLLVAESGDGETNPFLLPDDSGLLYQRRSSADQFHAMLLDFETGETTEIAQGTGPRYSPTGHVIFGDPRGSGFAIPFDLASKQATGEAVPVLPSLTVYGGGATQLDFSQNGTLIYADRGPFAQQGGYRPFVWVDMDGNEEEIPLEVDQAFVPRVSPDGSRIAYQSGPDIWIYDVVGGSNTQLTEPGTINEDPLWSPDGRYIYFTSEREGSQDADGYRKLADFTGEAEVVFSLPGENEASSISPDGQWIVIRDESAESERESDLLVTSTEPGGEVRDYLRADWSEIEGAVSPDGRWMAYTAFEFGEPRIFVRAFPDPGERWQVSRGIGWNPVWSPEGDAIYYQEGSFGGTLTKATIAAGETFRVESSDALFPFTYSDGGAQTGFDIDPDGDRFLMVLGSSNVFGIGDVYVVINWFDELRERMGEVR